MYKSRLQELCHQKHWNLPEYTATKQGPDHNPRFQASVTVNNQSFTTQNLCRSSKEAQNDAARLAFEHFTTPTVSQPSAPASITNVNGSSSVSTGKTSVGVTNEIPPVIASTPVVKVICRLRDADQAPQINAITSVGSTVFRLRDQTSHVNAACSAIQDVYRSRDTLHLYKNQLQSYAQKRNLALPIYSSEREGPPHASRFKCTVTISGQTYESQEFFPTLKEAENGAAKVALISLSPDVVQENDSGLYKNLLQELAQKEGYALPVYNANRSGEPHMPYFVSTVEVQGEVFTGKGARTKKQAEMTAAKVAYMTLKERISSIKPNHRPTVLSTGHQAQVDYSSSSSQSNATADLPQNDRSSGRMFLNPSSIPLVQAKEDRGNAEFSSQHLLGSFPQPEIITTQNRESSLAEPLPSAPSNPENDQASSSLPSDSAANFIPESIIRQTDEIDSSSCKRIIIYPCKPNMNFPKGSTVVRSDNEWVAVQLGPGQTSNLA